QGRLAEQGGGGGLVFRNAGAIEQRDRVLHFGRRVAAARRGREQLCRRGRVLRYAIALLVEGRERVLRLRASGICGAAQQLGGTRDVRPDALPIEIEQREVIGGRHVAELCRPLEQGGGLGYVPRGAAAGEFCHRKREDRLLVIAIGRELEPGQRFLIVLGDA